MSRAIAFQAVGSVGVLGSFAASEVAAYALGTSPGSPMLWFLNLEVFGIFEHARATPSPLRFIFAPSSVWIAAALIVVAVVAASCRRRFASALISHLSFAGALSLGSTILWPRSAMQAGLSLVPSVPGRFDTCLVITLMIVSALAAAAGHLSILRAAAMEAGSRPRLRVARSRRDPSLHLA